MEYEDHSFYVQDCDKDNQQDNSVQEISNRERPRRQRLLPAAPWNLL